MEKDLNKLLQQKQEELKKLIEQNNYLRQQLNQSDQQIIECNGQIKLLNELTKIRKIRRMS